MRQVSNALLFVAGAAVPASAEDLTLSYEAVMHVREVNAIPVLDRVEHQVGIGRFRGLAIFPDGVIVHRYEGWFDLTEGSGPFQGYAMWTFGDGSELRAAYDGEALQDPAGGVRVSADLRDFEGTGRFEGVTGTGGFSGQRLDTLEEGGATHVTGLLDLTLPD
jgi:hypothetical protein